MFGDFGKMLSMMAKVKANLPAMKEKIANSQFQAAAGGGAVTATVNGRLQLVDLEIKPELLKELDAELLADLVKASVSAAQEKAALAAAEAMKELAGGIELPGMDGLL